MCRVRQLCCKSQTRCRTYTLLTSRYCVSKPKYYCCKRRSRQKLCRFTACKFSCELPPTTAQKSYKSLCTWPIASGEPGGLLFSKSKMPLLHTSNYCHILRTETILDRPKHWSSGNSRSRLSSCTESKWFTDILRWNRSLSFRDIKYSVKSELLVASTWLSCWNVLVFFVIIKIIVVIFYVVHRWWLNFLVDVANTLPVFRWK